VNAGRNTRQAILASHGHGVLLMANVEQAWKRTKAFEGGAQSNPRDPGNYCKGRLIGTAPAGLTPDVFGEYVGRCPVDLAELTDWAEKNGANVFKWRFWDRVAGDQIASQAKAEALADFAFNAGAGAPLAFLRSYNYLQANGRPDVTKLNAQNDVSLLDTLTNYRRSYHMKARNAKGEWLWPHFWRGWERRIAAFSRPGIYPENSENLLRQWRVRWYNNPNGPVDPPRPAPDPGAIVSTGLLLFIPAAVAYFAGPRLWRMVRKGFK
jgi:lysozyme family protein